METAMTDPNRITLYYSPQTRATGTRVLLEELAAPYDLHVLNMKAGEQRQPAYLAINPLGKVPAIRHGEALVTEQVAIYIYLADLFPKAGLTPSLDADVWLRAAKGRICGLCRAHPVAARLPADHRCRCRDGGPARRALRRVSGTDLIRRWTRFA